MSSHSPRRFTWIHHSPLAFLVILSEAKNPRIFWCRILCPLLLAFASTFAHAAKFDWTPPTPAELAMTSDPKAPEAPAVILSYDQIDDNQSGEILLHVRIKVLKDSGRSVGDFNRLDGEFKARTIHPNGTIVPLVIPSARKILGIFPGKMPPALATALADVTVGSIVEYIYRSTENYYAPTWTVQHEYFTHTAHYTFKTPAKKDTRWIAHLPPGAEVHLVKDHADLELTNVARAPNEDFMPPATAAIYNVRFFYYSRPTETFWAYEAEQHTEFWDKYTEPDKTLKAAVSSLIQPTDSEMVKLRKLYAAVQALENTDLSRSRSVKEEMRSGIAFPENAGQVWTRQRGNSYQMTLLFLGLARTAGLDASAMAIASRGHAIFDLQVLDWRQLDAIVAIIRIEGKLIVLDPGVKACPFSHLAPWHSRVTGLTVYNKHLLSLTTPYDNSQGSRVDRTAELKLDPSGNVTGTVTLVFGGTAGLSLRLGALIEDEQFVRMELEKSMQESVPSGIDIKLQSLTGLADAESPLAAKLSVTGTLAVPTSRRLIVPAQFFSSTSKGFFTAVDRATPVALPERYATREQMSLTLSPGLSVETLPKSKIVSIPLASAFSSRLQAPAQGANVLNTQRIFSLDRLDYTAEEYEALHRYFSQIAEIDQEQIVLSIVSAPPAKSPLN
jgi:hypothetical protein